MFSHVLLLLYFILKVEIVVHNTNDSFITILNHVWFLKEINIFTCFYVWLYVYGGIVMVRDKKT